MGLAAAKNKRKLGADPNNTKWANQTDSFGQKILRSHGWQPGQHLGARDAAHAAHYTDGSASHIRVLLKDDNLGLGAKRNNGDECTGLDAFQNLLGRLNGKSEEMLEKEQKVRSELKLSLYVERKVGTVRFVRGGWLVGEDIKKEAVVEMARKVDDSKKTSASSRETSSDSKEASAGPEEGSNKDEEEVKEKKKKPKKRKAEAEDETTVEDEIKEEKRSKKKRRKEVESDQDDGLSRKSKKEKKSKKSKLSASDEEGAQTSSESVAETPAVPEDTDAASAPESNKSKPKKSRDKKDKKREKVIVADETAEDSEKSSRKKKRRKDKGDVPAAVEEEVTASSATPTDTADSTPIGSGYSTPTLSSSMRNISRRKFIAQKQMALSDPKALAQIFMIKTPS